MSKTLIVAWREFKTTALTKAFIFAAIGMPILMIALAILGPILFNPKPPPLDGVVAIVDPAGKFAAAAQIEMSPERIRERITREIQSSAEEAQEKLGQGDVMRSPGVTNQIAQFFDINLKLENYSDPADLNQLKGKLKSGEITVIVTTFEEKEEKDGPKTTPVRLYIPSNMNVKHTGLLEDMVQASSGRARVQDAGLDVDEIRELARAPEPDTVRMSDAGEEKAEGKGTKVFKMMTPMAFMMLIWIGAFVSANYLLTTTIEEKSNKIMEVLLSAISPMQLMTGKIIGQAMVGMVMVGMYLSLGIAILIAMTYMDLIEVKDLVFFGLYYIMAYFMIAAIMAAIGSAVNELREAQSLMTPAMLLLMIPLMLWLPISDSPNGMLAQVTSFIPPLTPFVMILRTTGSEPIPTWQIAASLVWGYAAMIGMIWMAAKVFRVGVLMYGKPPTPMELLRWVRYR
jgi:ABC-2 type transport system permease protein